jgi:hypothetical protein
MVEAISAAIVRPVGAWGAASFENDAANEWFYLVEEAVDPGVIIASVLDDAVGEADHLDLTMSCETIAAAELSASCAGEGPSRLPDHVRHWVSTHLHEPHDAEIERAVQAVTRVRSESELQERWEETDGGPDNQWLREVDDLIRRLKRSGSGDPATLSP